MLGCGETAVERAVELLGGAADGINLEFATRQIDLLGALSDPQGDPIPWLSRSVRISTPTERTPANAYLQLITRRLSPAHGEVEALEVFAQNDDLVTVIARHPALLPTVTLWAREGVLWRAVLISTEVSEASLRRIRRPPTSP
jgi:hypothetical protein